MTLVDVRTVPLSIDECIAAVSRPDAGGLAIFVGVVRDHNAGQCVTRLEYEAYESMARKEMCRIVSEIESEVEGARLAALHRFGSLTVGDYAVICVASAPHREEAFSACRLLIDRVKERVPIWKREHGSDGPYWLGWEDARIGPEGRRG